MLTSPLVVYVSILAAAYFQATARGVDVEMSVDVITTRSELIRGINECLNGRDGPDGVSDEALVAVMGLSSLEVCTLFLLLLSCYLFVDCWREALFEDTEC